MDDNPTKDLKVLVLDGSVPDSGLVEAELRKSGRRFTTERLAPNEGFAHALDEFKPDIIVTHAKPVKLLVLEDTESDAELEIREVRNAGIGVVPKRVATKKEFIEALEDFKPDIVLLDHNLNLPDFDGRAAAEIIRRESPDLPAILVTGALGDEAAVDLIKLGVTDYVLKDRPARLGPAVRSALLGAVEKRHRKAAEMARDALARIVETAHCGVIAIRVDGTVTSWNQSAERIYGYDAAEIIGKSIEVLVAPKDRPYFQNLHLRIAGGEEIAAFETNHLTKDGKPLNISMTMSPIPGSAGATLGYSIIAFDITARKVADELLTKERVLRDAIIGSFPGTFFVLDRDGRHIRWNDAERNMAGLTNGAMSRSPLLDLVHPKDRERVADMIDKVFQTGASEIQARAIDAQGGVHRFLFTGKRLAMGTETYLVGHGVEITKDAPKGA
jgi:PAS domain S-box-containing protein